MVSRRGATVHVRVGSHASHNDVAGIADITAPFLYSRLFFMHVTFRTRPSWSACGTVSFSLFLVIFINLHLSWGAQKLGERALQELSPAQISSLVSKPDPTRNLNPNDPNSHLSKILIPRPREPSLVLLLAETVLLNSHLCSGHGQ